MKKPILSIITPTHNHERFIAQCIESVLAQNYHDWEMIIIDDASTDETSAIIEKYAKMENRIKLIQHKQNWGIYQLGRTYNQALEFAKGDYIAVLEGDDFWPKYKLERQLSSLKNSKKILSWGKDCMVNTEGYPIENQINISNSKMINLYKNEPPGSILNLLLLQNIIKAVTTIIQKNALLSINGFQQPASVSYVDYPTWLKLALEGSFDFIDETLGFWRRHASQATAYFKLEQEKEAKNLALNFFNNLTSKTRNFLFVTEKKISKNWNSRIAKANFYKGRLHLINKEWSQARKNFMMAINRGPYFMKSVYLFGLFASLIKFNLEQIAGFFNKRLI